MYTIREISKFTHYKNRLVTNIVNFFKKSPSISKQDADLRSHNFKVLVSRRDNYYALAYGYQKPSRRDEISGLEGKKHVR